MRFRYKYVNAVINRKTGFTFYYFRRDRSQPAIRLNGSPGSAEFLSSYAAALDLKTPRPVAAELGVNRTRAGSVNAAVVQYLKSTAFGQLSEGTKQSRRAILDRFREKLGERTFAMMPPAFIKGALAELQPHAARNWLKTLRGLMTFAVDVGLCEADPTIGIKAKLPKSSGHETWTEDQIAQFETYHPIGSKPRLALALLVYTGQRSSDVVRMGRQHIRNGKIIITQEKRTGGRDKGVTVHIPIHPRLADELAAAPATDLTFLINDRGAPFNPNRFATWFKEQVLAAGLPEGLVPHGLRKACCRRLAEAGCTPHEIASISGHLTLKEVQHYSEAFDRERAGEAAFKKLGTFAEQK